MKNTLKVIERNIEEYNDDRYYDDGGYAEGYVILEAIVDGKTVHFKIPAYMNSDYGITYTFDCITEVVPSTVEKKIWISV